MKEADFAMSKAKPPLWIVLRAHFRASPRKTGLLIALAVILVVVYVRLFMTSSSPSEAGAAVTDAPGPDPTGVNPGGTAHKAGPVAQRVPLSVPVSTRLARNPFVVDPSKFPITNSPVDPGPVSATPGEGPTADPNEMIRAAASELTLQAVFYGESPLACINGEVVSPGQEIAGFHVKRIEPTRVVLHQGGIDVALNLR